MVRGHPYPQYGEPSSVELRSTLLAASFRFVHRASVLEGVHRIALIGSLASEKPFPKDVDLLTTISDDVDLCELARLGRQLSGTAQTINSGADVFLANPEHCYLGRTCPWRECGPGRRVRCGAEYLSGRLFLRDDIVELSDGRTLAVPLGWYPRLLHDTAAERGRWRLIGRGEGIRWPDLDEDISVEGILLGRPSGEIQRSLQRWLQQRRSAT